MLAGDLGGQRRLRQLNAQHRAALLALAGEIFGGAAVQLQLHVVPVGAVGAKAGAAVRHAAGGQRFGQRARFRPAAVAKAQRLAAAADLFVIFLCQRGQPFQKKGAPPAYLFALHRQVGVEGVAHLRRAGGALPEF